MIASVHQPHFLPWKGYFNKVLQSDVFVWLHNVQYRKNYYQNRTRIRGSDSKPSWLTLPVHARLGTPIDAVRLVDPRDREGVCKTLEQRYARAPFFAECWPALRSALRAETDLLEEIDWRSFDALLGLLGGGPRIVRAGSLPDSKDPTDRLVAICREIGATRYIAGRGGKKYMRLEPFRGAGIEILWQDYLPDAPDEDRGLSTVDTLFHLGPSKTRAAILAGWRRPD
jgi:hypothetical protein